MNEQKSEIITVTVSEYLSNEFAKKIGTAQWNCPEGYYRVRQWLNLSKTETGYFNVIAQNEHGSVIGRLSCLQNKSDPKLWHYGDLFVISEYRRRHIAERMLFSAIETLKDRDCKTVRAYVEPENLPSISFHRKFGFTQKPYEVFDELIHDEGELMFEKELGSAYEAISVQNADDVKYIAEFYWKNSEKLHGKKISYSQWCSIITEKDSDEEHFLICRGAMPVAWLKINGLESTGTGWISMLAVEPSFQRRGIGRFAVKFAEDFLTSKGKHQIGVQTTEDNAPALALYLKCGFKEIEKYPAVADDGSEVVKVKLTKDM